MSACRHGGRRPFGANGGRRPSRHTRPLAAVLLALLGGGLLPQPYAQEARDERALPDGVLGAEAETPSLRYERARALAFSGATAAALAEFDALLAEFPRDADYLLGRAQMQVRLGQDAAAAETAERALAVAPDYEDVWQLRLRLAERSGDDAAAAALRARVAARFPDASWWQRTPPPVEHRRWLSAGFGADRLSNGTDWSREFLRLDWQTAAAGTLFGEVSRSERFAESDSSLNAGGIWDVLPRWQLGAAVGATPEPRFLPQRELAVDATRAWAAGWGTAFGLRRRDYATGDVSSYSFTAEKYVSDYRVAYRLDRSRLEGAESALSHSLAVTWYPSERRSLGVTLGAGEEIEVIGLDQLLHTSVANVTITGNEELSARLSLRWWLGTHEQGDFYRRDYAGLSVRIGL